MQTLFERVTATHFHHGASSDYRVLAAWPDYLRLALDEALEPVVRTEEYDAAAQTLLVHARGLVLVGLVLAKDLDGPAPRLVDLRLPAAVLPPHLTGLDGLSGD